MQNKPLKLGNGVVSRAALLALVRQPFSKVVLHITEKQILGSDRMDHKVASAACHARVRDELKRPEEQATKEYLVMMHHIEVAYIIHDATPGQRIYSAWYIVFFFRIWRLKLAAEISHPDERPNAFNAKMQANFVSPNLQACLELNGHGWIILNNSLRDIERPDLFTPSQINSQASEDSFRTLRSLSSVRSTIVNFDMLDLSRRSKRLAILEEAATTVKDFHFLNKKKDIIVPEVLLTNAEINNILKSGFNDVKIVMAKFGKWIF